MPTISAFYGIMIRMYLQDHNPPHFHAFYAEWEGRIAIETGEIIEGFLPKNAARLVKEWTLARQALLMDNWTRAHSGTPLQKIAGLDAE
jgi:hypothetical protein